MTRELSTQSFWIRKGVQLVGAALATCVLVLIGVLLWLVITGVPQLIKFLGWWNLPMALLCWVGWKLGAYFAAWVMGDYD